MSLFLLHHGLLDFLLNFEHFFDKSADLVELNCVIFFENAQALHFALQLHDYLKFLLSLVNLNFFLQPDGLGDEKVLREEGALLDRLLDESHEEKGPEGELVGDAHLVVLVRHIVEAELSVQKVIVIFRRCDSQQLLLLNHFKVIDRVSLRFGHKLLQLHNFVSVHTLVHFENAPHFNFGQVFLLTENTDRMLIQLDCLLVVIFSLGIDCL